MAKGRTGWRVSSTALSLRYIRDPYAEAQTPMATSGVNGDGAGPAMYLFPTILVFTVAVSGSIE
jgi:hypothetical protein